MRRYFETLFRTKEAFLIVLLVVPTLALLVTVHSGKQYKVEAFIWVDQSPLLDSSSRPLVTRGQAESKALGEWLSTETFRQEVINRSGLGAAIQEGKWPVSSRLGIRLSSMPLLGKVARALGIAPPATRDEANKRALNLVKKSIRVTAAGDNLVKVTYVGKEAELGKRIIEEMLSLYSEETIARQVREGKLGVDFYTRQAQIQKERENQAAIAIKDFYEQYPEPLPGQSRPPSELAALAQLQSAYTLEHELYTSALRTLEDVRIRGEAAVSGRNESFRIVDPPVVPDQASLSSKQLVVALFMGLTLGALLGLLPVILLTWLDNSVRTREDIEAMAGVPLIVQTPLVANGRMKRRGWLRWVVARGRS